MIKVVLFDLDGTLLPMDQEVFVQNYFGRLAKKLAPYGYDSKKLIDAIWTGTAAMVKNTGELNNEAVFWKKFDEIYGKEASKDKPIFEEFYQKEFQEVESVCGKNQEAVSAVRKIKELGFRVALATNPIFPSIATESRVRWAGLSVDEFELYTTYENSYHCKPNPEYYKDILKKIHVKPEECLMVGNDVSEDMVAESIGMHVFLLTDCMINKDNKDISVYPHGGFVQLLEFIDKF